MPVGNCDPGRNRTYTGVSNACDSHLYTGRLRLGRHRRYFLRRHTVHSLLEAFQWHLNHAHHHRGHVIYDNLDQHRDGEIPYCKDHDVLFFRIGSNYRYGLHGTKTMSIILFRLRFAPLLDIDPSNEAERDLVPCNEVQRDLVPCNEVKRDKAADKQ